MTFVICYIVFGLGYADAYALNHGDFRGYLVRAIIWPYYVGKRVYQKTEEK